MDHWKAAEIRFWSRVVKSDGCWEYRPHAKRRSKINVDKQHYMVYRFSWIIHFGAIPDGMFVCHHCDNPKCVRPDHLFVGTPAENSADMVRKGRARTSPNRNMAKGTDHPLAKLDPEKVRELRRLRTEGLTYAELAVRFGVTQRAVASVLTGITWKHVA